MSQGTEIVLNDFTEKKLDYRDTDPLLPVEAVPITFQDKVTGKHIVITHEDGTRDAVAQVGASYNLFPNQVALDVGNEIMSQSDMIWNPTQHIWDGKRFVQMFKTEEVAIEMPSTGDVINYGLRIENSYDGSCRLRMAIMAFVLACTNGMISDRLFGAFSLKHIGGVDDFDLDDAQEELKAGTDRLLRFGKHFDHMGNAGFSIEHLRTIAQDKRVSPTFIGKFITQSNVDIEPGGMSQWDALNVGTRMLREPSKVSELGTLAGWTEGFLDIAGKEIA